MDLHLSWAKNLKKLIMKYLVDCSLYKPNYSPDQHLAALRAGSQKITTWGKFDTPYFRIMKIKCLEKSITKYLKTVTNVHKCSWRGILDWCIGDPPKWHAHPIHFAPEKAHEDHIV